MDELYLEQRLAAACAIAREAGILAKRRFLNKDNQALEFKGHHDYLTATDQEVEALIVGRLGALFEEDTFLGEEEGGTPGKKVWVIDPIDGTENFARGIPHFCISIAYVVENEVLLGVVYQPITDELFTARSGHGAHVNGTPMRVSETSDLNRTSVEVGWSARKPMPDYLELVRRVTDSGASFKRAGSGTLGIVYVADGRMEGYVELHINSWDALAALLMVREAGGWTNDFLANNGLTQGNPVMATTHPLKEGLLKATAIIP